MDHVEQAEDLADPSARAGAERGVAAIAGVSDDAGDRGPGLPARLAVLVLRPRVNLVLYHGVLAPAGGMARHPDHVLPAGYVHPLLKK